MEDKECGLAKGYLSEYDRGYQDGSKETAEKFYDFAKVWFEYIEQNDYLEEVKNLAKQCGVEIKE